MRSEDAYVFGNAVALLFEAVAEDLGTVSELPVCKQHARLTATRPSDHYAVVSRPRLCLNSRGLAGLCCWV